MLSKIKKRCGIAEMVTVFDDEIQDLVNSAKTDLMASGVVKEVLISDNEQLINAITCYVKAYRGNDRSDSEKYIKMYQDLRLYLKFLTVEDLELLKELKEGVEDVE